LTCGELSEAVESLLGKVEFKGSKHLSPQAFAVNALRTVASRAIPHFGGKLPVFRVRKTSLSRDVPFWARFQGGTFWHLFHVEHFPF
jgi:hypothetical protein